MEPFKIEKGIPVPVSKTGNLPLAEMEVNDSFLFPIEPYTISQRTLVCTAVITFGKRKNPIWKFTAHKVEGGVRIWRVE